MLVLLMCVGRSIQRLLGKHIPGEIDLQLCVARRSTSGAGLDIENNYCEMQGVHDELNEDEVAGHCGYFWAGYGALLASFRNRSAISTNG